MDSNGRGGGGGGVHDPEEKESVWAVEVCSRADSVECHNVAGLCCLNSRILS